jgi:hypothetical protein
MYPTLKDKKFTDLTRGDVITIQDQFEDIAILDNGQRIKVDRLLDKSYYDEYIDPKTFFGDTFNVFAEKIKALPAEALDSIKDEDDYNTSAIIEVDPGEERRLLEKKAREMSSGLNSGAQVQKQIDMLKEIMGDEDLPVIKNFDQTQPTQPTEPPIQRVIAPSVQSVTDPITTMFKNVKRNKDFSFTIEIGEKIPRLDFIEMMEDSYETSIIDFLSEEFTQKILSNPDYIKSKISDEIKRLVYPNQKEESEELELITDKSTSPLEQINDSSTVVKKTTTRKSSKKSEKAND